MFQHLAEILGDNWLVESVVDGLVRAVRRRMGPAAGDHIVADLAFTRYIIGYGANELASKGKAELERYEDFLRSEFSAKVLVFPLYSPPHHWIAGAIDCAAKAIRFGDPRGGAPPTAFVQALQKWLYSVMSWSSVRVTRDLPCGVQQDSFNCGVIAPNTIARLVLK